MQNSAGFPLFLRIPGQKQAFIESFLLHRQTDIRQQTVDFFEVHPSAGYYCHGAECHRDDHRYFGGAWL